MIEAVCDCRAVRLAIAEEPEEANDCQCAWCQRLGVNARLLPRDVRDRARVFQGRQ